MIDSMKMLANKDLDIVCPSESSASGGASVGYSIRTNILEKALQNIPDNTDTEMMIWHFLKKLMESRWMICLIGILILPK